MPRIAYLDCQSGISGDMMLGALIDAGVGLAPIDAAIGSLGLPDCRLRAEEVRRHGFRATQAIVDHAPEHAHRHLSRILGLIDGGKLTPRQKALARQIFTRLGEAEAKVHGVDIEEVHFHEVGAVDSIADIVGTAVGWDLLGAERLVASPVPTGCGAVTIAHGQCGVPAPATAELLRGVPLAESSVRCELTTPTGAAILATLADAFGPMPAMRLEGIGYGAGSRELKQQPNLLRLLVGETTEPDLTDRVWMLETNLDDLSGQMIGYCIGRLWDARALDVYTTPIQMKKNRPGVKLSVLCREADVDVLEHILFSETTTLGVRRWPLRRHILARQRHTVQTAWGPIEGKVRWQTGHPPRFAPEFEACRRIAAEREVPLRAVHEAAQQAFDANDVEPLEEE